MSCFMFPQLPMPLISSSLTPSFLTLPSSPLTLLSSPPTSLFSSSLVAPSDLLTPPSPASSPTLPNSPLLPSSTLTTNRELLGDGAVGIVYGAVFNDTGVALKIADLSKDSRAMREFQNEVLIYNYLAGAQGKIIPHLVWYGIATTRCIPEHDASEEEKREVVEKLSQFGVEHGDVRDDNFVRSPDGQLFIIDFGLSRLSGLFLVFFLVFIFFFNPPQQVTTQSNNHEMNNSNNPSFYFSSPVTSLSFSFFFLFSQHFKNSSHNPWILLFPIVAELVSLFPRYLVTSRPSHTSHRLEFLLMKNSLCQLELILKTHLIKYKHKLL